MGSISIIQYGRGMSFYRKTTGSQISIDKYVSDISALTGEDCGVRGSFCLTKHIDYSHIKGRSLSIP